MKVSKKTCLGSKIVDIYIYIYIYIYVCLHVYIRLSLYVVFSLFLSYYLSCHCFFVCVFLEFQCFAPCSGSSLGPQVSPPAQTVQLWPLSSVPVQNVRFSCFQSPHCFYHFFFLPAPLAPSSAPQLSPPAQAPSSGHRLRPPAQAPSSGSSSGQVQIVRFSGLSKFQNFKCFCCGGFHTFIIFKLLNPAQAPA